MLACGSPHCPDAERRLHEVGVTVNAISVPFDKRQPESTSGLRLGTPALTMRGFDQEDMSEVAEIIVGALDESADLDALAARAASLCERRPLYPGFDGYCRYSPGSQAPVRRDNVFAMDERSKRWPLPISAIRVASAEA